MPTKFPEIFAALAAPFLPGEVKEREESGRRYQYITWETAAVRLDDVLGPENWEDEYFSKEREHSVRCRLTIILPDGRRVRKENNGGYATAMKDLGDKDMSGFSFAFKRAAERFGIARYLKGDGIPFFAMEAQGEVFKAPPWYTALSGSRPDAAPDLAPGVPESGLPPVVNAAGTDPVPKTVPELRQWAQDRGRETGVELAGYLRDWAVEQRFPPSAKDWGLDHVRSLYAEGLFRLLAAKTAAGGHGAP